MLSEVGAMDAYDCVRLGRANLKSMGATYWLALVP
jgi:hypothetical protein